LNKDKDIFVCLKNGFGDQLLQLAFALNAYENLKEKFKVNLYIITDILYENEQYNYKYKSILPEYIKVKNAHFNTVRELNLERLNNREERRYLFKQVVFCNSIFIANEKYFNDFKFYQSGRYKLFTDGLDYTKLFLTLKKYCSFFNIKDFKVDNRLHDRIGINLRFRDRMFYKQDNEIKNTLLYLYKIKDEKLYITYDNNIFNEENIISKIDTSNDVIIQPPFDLQDLDSISSYEDYSTRQNSEEQYYMSQLASLQLAINLASCRRFIGTLSSNFSKYFIPLMRYSIRS